MSDAVARDAGILELTLERDFAHPVEAVFKAWTQQDALRQWMGPGEITAPDSRMDARVGGKLTIPMTYTDGTVLTARGEIAELILNRKLRFTWVWDQQDGGAGQVMEITLHFTPTPAGTHLVLHQTNFIDAEARGKHQSGWSGCFEKLEKYLTAA